MAHILILGGGAAGLAAALAAAQAAPAARVTVLERNPKVGKKLLATGNGRCNLDNTAIALEKYFTAAPAAAFAGGGGCRRAAGVVRAAGAVHPHR